MGGLFATGMVVHTTPEYTRLHRASMFTQGNSSRVSLTKTPKCQLVLTRLQIADWVISKNTLFRLTIKRFHPIHNFSEVNAIWSFTKVGVGSRNGKNATLRIGRSCSVWKLTNISKYMAIINSQIACSQLISLFRLLATCDTIGQMKYTLINRGVYESC